MDAYFAQGTEESRKEIEAALENLLGIHRWTFDEVERRENLVALEFDSCFKQLHEDCIKIAEDFQFGLEVPTQNLCKPEKGNHTEYFDIFCANCSMQRTYPNCVCRKLEVSTPRSCKV